MKKILSAKSVKASYRLTERSGVEQLQYVRSIMVRYRLTCMGYDYIVRDCGTIAGLSAQADIKIVVTDFGYRRRLEYERLLQSDKDSLIFVNHTDGNVFYKETGRLEIKRQFYRIPCVYDWNNGSKLLDRVFLEALSAVISKPCRKQVKGGAGAGRKYIISKNK